MREDKTRVEEEIFRIISNQYIIWKNRLIMRKFLQPCMTFSFHVMCRPFQTWNLSTYGTTKFDIFF